MKEFACELELDKSPLQLLSTHGGRVHLRVFVLSPGAQELRQEEGAGQ